MPVSKQEIESASGAEEDFSAEERAAMKERARELRTARGRGKNKDLEPEVLAAIAEMPDADRVLAERIHAIVREVAPQLSPRLWYGQPAYARDGKVVCFFQAAAKFGGRYATFGFNDVATLDDGPIWPTAFAVVKLTGKEEKQIADLVRRATR